MRQTGKWHMQLMRGHRVAEGDHLIGQRRGTQQRHQRGRALQDHVCPARAEERKVARKLEGIAIPLFRIHQEHPARERLTLPTRHHGGTTLLGERLHALAPFVFGPPLRPLTAGQQRDRQIEVRARLSWGNGQYGTGLLLGQRVVLQAIVRRYQIRPAQQVRWLQLQRAPIRGHRLRHTPRRLQRPPQTVPRKFIGGAERCGAGEGRHRIGRTPGRHQGIPQIQQHGCRTRQLRGQWLEEGDRTGGIAGFKAQHAKRIANPHMRAITAVRVLQQRTGAHGVTATRHGQRLRVLRVRILHVSHLDSRARRSGERRELLTRRVARETDGLLHGESLVGAHHLHGALRHEVEHKRRTEIRRDDAARFRRQRQHHQRNHVRGIGNLQGREIRRREVERVPGMRDERVAQHERGIRRRDTLKPPHPLTSSWLQRVCATLRKAPQRADKVHDRGSHRIVFQYSCALIHNS